MDEALRAGKSERISARWVIAASFVTRRLEDEYPYVILDARYERVREDGVGQSRAVLIALGIGWAAAATSCRWKRSTARAPPAGRITCSRSSSEACMGCASW